MTGSASRSDPTRRALIDAAIAEIVDHGITGLRIQRVCRAAGVTTGALYFHFGNRQGLISEALHDRFSDLTRDPFARLRALYESDLDLDDYLAGLRSAMDFLFSPEQRAFRQLRLQALAHAQHDEEFRERFAEVERRFFDDHRELIEMADRHDRIAIPAARTTITAFYFSFGFGVSALELLDESRVDTSELLDLISRFERSMALGDPADGGAQRAIDPAVMPPST